MNATTTPRHLRPTPMYHLWVPASGKGRNYQHAMLVMAGPLPALRRHVENVNQHSEFNFQIRRWDRTVIGTPIKAIRLP